MIRGEVTARREAIIEVRLGGSHGSQVTLTAILDTGFDDFLTLPPLIIEKLGLTQIGSMPIRVADGHISRVALYEAGIYWEGERRIITVQATEGDILIGMALLYGYFVTLEVVDGGAITIEAIE